MTQTKSYLVSPLEQISSLAFNLDLSPNECLLGIRNVLTSRQSTIDKCRNNLIELENSFQPVEQDNAYYSALEIKSRKLQNRAAGIIKLADFTGDKELINAIRYFQTRDIMENTAPVGFLSDQEQKYLRDDKGNFRISLYKAVLFLKVAEALKSGSLSLPYSYKYRQLNDYLIPEEQWRTKRDVYIKQAGLEDLVDIEKLLFISVKELKISYEKVNQLVLIHKCNPMNLFS